MPTNKSGDAGIYDRYDDRDDEPEWEPKAEAIEASKDASALLPKIWFTYQTSAPRRQPYREAPSRHVARRPERLGDIFRASSRPSGRGPAQGRAEQDGARRAAARRVLSGAVLPHQQRLQRKFDLFGRRKGSGLREGAAVLHRTLLEVIARGRGRLAESVRGRPRRVARGETNDRQPVRAAGRRRESRRRRGRDADASLANRGDAHGSAETSRAPRKSSETVVASPSSTQVRAARADGPGAALRRT